MTAAWLLQQLQPNTSSPPKKNKPSRPYPMKHFRQLQDLFRFVSLLFSLSPPHQLPGKPPRTPVLCWSPSRLISMLKTRSQHVVGQLRLECHANDTHACSTRFCVNPPLCLIPKAVSCSSCFHIHLSSLIATQSGPQMPVAVCSGPSSNCLLSRQGNIIQYSILKPAMHMLKLQVHTCSNYNDPS